MVLLFILGRHDIFHWTHDGIMTKGSANYDKIVAGKSGFLGFWFYLIRMVSYLTIWGVFLAFATVVATGGYVWWYALLSQKHYYGSSVSSPLRRDFIHVCLGLGNVG
ncbi:MAG: hypothetical protein WKG07_15735 [Hymenobacter sp.]